MFFSFMVVIYSISYISLADQGLGFGTAKLPRLFCLGRNAQISTGPPICLPRLSCLDEVKPFPPISKYISVYTHFNMYQSEGVPETDSCPCARWMWVRCWPDEAGYVSMYVCMYVCVYLRPPATPAPNPRIVYVFVGGPPRPTRDPPRAAATHPEEIANRV